MDAMNSTVIIANPPTGKEFISKRGKSKCRWEVTSEGVTSWGQPFIWARCVAIIVFDKERKPGGRKPRFAVFHTSRNESETAVQIAL